MPTFTSVREAKEFLIDSIVQEARRDHVPLSEIERKMLYFSETAWTLQDVDQISADFDNDYDQDEYEQKIGSLVWNLRKRMNPDELKTWDSAVRHLRSEDHYLLVLIDAANFVTRSYTLKSPLAWGIALGMAIMSSILLYMWSR